MEYKLLEERDRPQPVPDRIKEEIISCRRDKQDKKTASL